jgi:hypothetical protein
MDITIILSLILHSIYVEHGNESYCVTSDQLEDIKRELIPLIGREIDMTKEQLVKLGSVLSGLCEGEILDGVEELEESLEEFKNNLTV